MNYWMKKIRALFIRKMNIKCLFWTKRAPFAYFSLFLHCFLKLWFVFQFEWIIFLNEYFWFNFEWIILLNEYSWFNFELNIELHHFLARFNVKMNDQNLSPCPICVPSNIEENKTNTMTRWHSTWDCFCFTCVDFFLYSCLVCWCPWFRVWLNMTGTY